MEIENLNDALSGLGGVLTRDTLVASWRCQMAKVHEKLRKNACRPLKIDDLIADATVRVENAHENWYSTNNTKLLSKFRSIYF